MQKNIELAELRTAISRAKTGAELDPLADRAVWLALDFEKRFDETLDPCQLILKARRQAFAAQQYAEWCKLRGWWRDPALGGEEALHGKWQLKRELKGVCNLLSEFLAMEISDAPPQ